MIKFVLTLRFLLGFIPFYAQTAVPDSVKHSTYFTEDPYVIMTWKNYKNGIKSYIKRDGYEDSILSKTDYYINDVDSSIIVDGKKVYLKCDKPPYFHKLKAYFEENQPWIYTNLEFIIWVGAIVHEDGGLSHIGIVRGGSSLFEIPTFQLIMKMPKWQPGEIGGQKVNAYIMFPVALKCGM
jgi:hypothetical protein